MPIRVSFSRNFVSGKNNNSVAPSLAPMVGDIFSEGKSIVCFNLCFVDRLILPSLLQHSLLSGQRTLRVIFYDPQSL